jgi:branched-chain amino acid transport system substrate-binding protein
MKKKLCLMFASAGFALIFLAPLMGAQVEAAAPKPIKIGLLLTYTGFGAIGPWEERGARLAVSDTGGEIAGRPIELLVEDSASDPSTSVEKARKLVEKDNVDVLIGPIMGSCAPAVAAYAKESGIPYIFNGQAAREVILAGGRNCFDPFGTTARSTWPVSVYSYDVLGARTVTVIHDDFSQIVDRAKNATEAFVSRGGQVLQVQRTPLETVDYGPNLSVMKQADAVFFWFIPFNALRFVKQYFQSGLKMPLIMMGNPTLNEMDLPMVGDPAIGILSIAPVTCGIDTSAMRAFIDRWLKKYGHLTEKEGRYPRKHEGIYNYIAVQVYLEAVKATRGDTTPHAVSDALRKIKIETPGSLVSFTPEGIGIGDMYVLKVVKEGSRYYWKDIYSYKQLARDQP